MTYLLLAGGLVIPAVCVLFVVPPVQRLALRHGWVDAPDGGRKLHERPTPTLGGVAIAVGLAAGVAYFAAVGDLLPFDVTGPSLGLWIGALVMVLTGLYDDVHATGFKKKFLIQTLVAYFMLHVGYRVEVAHLPFIEGDVYYQALYNIPLTIIWIVGVINAVNLLDGLDGLAAGVALIGIASLGVVFGLRGELGVAVGALVIAGALLGFLAHNAPPASIFMGDSGSLLVGFLLATYALQARTHVSPSLALAIPVAALGLPVLETGVSIVRRLVDRRSPFAPDRDHIHHRLSRATTPRRAVLGLYGVSLLFGLTAALLVLADVYRGLFLLSLVAAGIALWLRKLGYLRVRSSLRTVKQRYDLSPPAGLPPRRLWQRLHRRLEAHEGATGDAVQSPTPPDLAPRFVGEGLLEGTNGELEGKAVVVWHPDSTRAADEARDASTLVRGLREKGAFVSVVDAGEGGRTAAALSSTEPVAPGAALEAADVVLVCTGGSVFCLRPASSLN